MSTLLLHTYTLVFTGVWYLALKRPGSFSQYSDSPRDGRSGVRIAVGGENFRTHPDRHWDTPSPLHEGYRVSFPGVKQAEAWR